MTPPSNANNQDELLGEIRALRERIAVLEAEKLDWQRLGDPCHSWLNTEGARHFLVDLPHGFEEIDLDGRIVWCNEARARLLGQEVQEIIGSYAWDRMANTEASGWVRQLIYEASVELPDPGVLYLDARHQDGSVVNLRVDWNYRRDAAGRVTGFLVLLLDMTREQGVKSALQKSLSQFEDFMTYCPGAAFMKDADGRYTMLNPNAAEVLGGEVDEILGKRDHDLLPPEAAELLRDNDRQVLESGQPFRGIEEIGEGRDAFKLLTVRFLVSGDDDRPHVAGMGLDITRSDREHQELCESRDRLREASDRLRLLSSAVAQSGEGVAIVYPDRRIEFVNEAFAGMHGFRVSELEGLDLHKVFAEGQPEQLLAVEEQLDSAGEFRGAIWHVAAGGGSFPCHESHSLVRDEDGRVIARIIVARDVSEAVAAEKRLQDAQAQLEQRVQQRTSELGEVVARLEKEIQERHRAESELRRIWDSTLELLVLMGRDGCIRRVNRSLERTLRVSEEDVMGQPFFNLVAEEDRGRTSRSWAKIRAASSGPRLMVRHLVDVPGQAKPEVRWLEWAVTSVEGTDLVYAAGRDLTELRMFEVRVARQQAELAHASRLTNMGEMASGIAHELNQPLCAIALRAEACKLSVLRNGPSEGVVSDLEYMREQAERAGEIIRRLRGFVARREPESKPVEPGQLVRDMLHFVETECEQEHIGLRVELEAGLPLVNCDEIQIQQVLLNLLRNAIEAILAEEEGCAGLSREILVQGVRKGPDIVLEVLDTGPGLSPKVGDHLFDPFFSTKSGGLGIGLSLSKSIVEAHGGSLLAYPREPRGMRFVLSLPVHAGPVRAKLSRYLGRSQRKEDRP
ncbi:MAG: hypothetical protein CSA62_07805 [Planctomycetota bacterium]|nr:MAG: hypothetical protein CSA62_07805 [Planctomycetota bacterium]